MKRTPVPRISLPYMKKCLKELFYDRLLPMNSGCNGNASTPMENIDIIPCFSKITILIEIKPVKIAALQEPLFWGDIL
jgi:hypothetical protein